MPRISIRAIAIALAAELTADYVIGIFAFTYFARGMLTPEMSRDELEKVADTVIATTVYLPWMILFGTATTIGGAYLAARIARRIPYYHGLAMGLAGIVQILIFWSSDRPWLNYLGLLITIPASLYGAHLAKKQMPAED
jgi:hypothetical protein